MKNKSFSIIISVTWIFLCALATFIIFILSIGMQFLDASVRNVVGSFMWTVIYFALPITAFILAILLKFKFKKSGLIFTIPILAYAIISFGTIYAINSYLSDFSQDKWVKYQSERYHMLDDMTNEINFVGMSKEEVIKMLGEPNRPYADTDNIDLIDYYVGSFSIDPTMITFVFEDNKVIEVYEYTEFRTSKKPLYQN